MSFARWGSDSDVYVYFSNDHRQYECHECTLSSENSWPVLAPTAAEMIRHLAIHRQAGQKVPERTFHALRLEPPP